MAETTIGRRQFTEPAVTAVSIGDMQNELNHYLTTISIPSIVCEVVALSHRNDLAYVEQSRNPFIGLTLR